MVYVYQHLSKRLKCHLSSEHPVNTPLFASLLLILHVLILKSILYVFYKCVNNITPEMPITYLIITVQN